MRKEVWRAIPAFRGWYAVSTRGRVKRVAAGKGTRAGRILKPAVQLNGYLFLRLSRGTAKSRTLCRVHRLVAAAFLGPARGRHVNHQNGRKTDNRPTNLEYTSPSANLRHAYGNGLATAACGERHGRAKLTERQVRAIRALAARGLQRGDVARLARRHGVARETIHDVIARRRWAHLKAAA